MSVDFPDFLLLILMGISDPENILDTFWSQESVV